VAVLKVVQGKHGTTRSLHPRNDVISSPGAVLFPSARGRQKIDKAERERYLLKDRYKSLSQRSSTMCAINDEHRVIDISHRSSFIPRRQVISDRAGMLLYLTQRMNNDAKL